MLLLSRILAGYPAARGHGASALRLGGCATKYADLCSTSSDDLCIVGAANNIFLDLLSSRGLFSWVPLPQSQLPGSGNATDIFRSEVSERCRCVLGARTCPGLRDDGYVALFGCPWSGTLGREDIRATGETTLAWHPSLAWRQGQVSRAVTPAGVGLSVPLVREIIMTLAHLRVPPVIPILIHN